MGRGPLARLKSRLVGSYSQRAASRRLRFDRNLPALPQAFDMSSVARLFEQHWSEISPGSPGPVRVRRCRLHTVRYEPSHCVSTYDLQVQRSGAGREQTIGAVQTTSAGLSPRLYTDDPHLPWLRRAADAGEVLPRLAALSKGTSGQLVVENSSVEAVRYFPGRRCTFRYTVASPEGVREFYGKAIRVKGERLMAMVQALYEQSQAMPAMPRLPRPLAYWPDLHLFVTQSVGAAATLKELAYDVPEEAAVRTHWFREAGTHLAALHLHGFADGPRRSFQRELDVLRGHSVPMAMADPALSRRFGAAIGQLESRTDGLHEPLHAVCHGRYRPNQLFLVDGRFALLDLDSLCLGNPVRDVGSFLAYLDYMAIRRPWQRDTSAAAGSAFLDGYRSGGTSVDPRWVSLYRSCTLLHWAGRLFRDLNFAIWPWAPARLLEAAIALVGETS